MQLGRMRWGDADNSSAPGVGVLGFTLTSRTKARSPGTESGTTQRVHPNDQPLAGVTKMNTSTN